MIDDLPQPGEHVPLPGQLTLLEVPSDECQAPREGTEARARLRDWWHCHRANFSPPRIESLRKLDLLCEVARDKEVWQLVKAAAEEELGPLGGRRYEWQQATAFETADDAIADEVNLMLARVCGPDPTPTDEGVTAMPRAAARTTKPEPKARKPARTKPAMPSAVETSTTARPELAGELVMIAIDQLHRSPYQTRREPTAGRLDELAESLRVNTQLTPCLVRRNPRGSGYELIGGHTRTAAGRRNGWKQMQCRLVDCDDATAQRLVLIDNATHEELTVIERAQALAALVENYAAAGKSQRDLAGDIGVSQSEISNSVRLLALPEVWQQRLITGEITRTQARDLLPWVDVPALWPELESQRADDEDGLSFDGLLRRALFAVSRPMSGSFFDETRHRWSMVAFKATTEERAHLNCQAVDGEVRAFNTALWDSMQHVAEDKAAAKSGKQAEATAGQVAAKKITPKQAAEQFNKRLYRWKVAWLQKRIAAALEDKTEADTLVLLLVWFAQDGHTASHERRTSLAKAFGVRRTSWYQTDAIHILQAVAAKPAAERTATLRRILQEWVQHPADTGSTDMPAPLVDWLAEHLGIDIVRQWSLDRSYLELLTTAQLQELATEWKLRPTDTKRGALIEWLAEVGKEKPSPKAVRGIKAESLT